MKRIIIYTFLSLIILSGCKKESGSIAVNEGISEEALQELTRQSGLLTESDFGWKVYLYPSGGSGYSFYMNFDTAGRVTMYADLDFTPSATSLESGYQIKTDQVPSLRFDNYNYMHALSLADQSTFGSPAEWGLYSDFEFNFTRQSGDTLILTGKLLDSKLILIKATEEERSSYISRGLYNSILATTNYLNKNPSLYVNLNGETKIQTSFNYLNKIFSLTWEEGGIINSQSSSFVFTLTGILLQNPLTYEGKKIGAFTWDAVKALFFTIINNERIEVIPSATPILPLNVLMGINYSSITVPYGTTYPGWSTNFQARRATVAAATLATSYFLRLERMVFSFNKVTKSMNFAAEVYQNTVRYVANFPYKFTSSTTGVYKFTAAATTGNAALITAEMAPLTAERLSVDQFTLSYFINPENGQVLGQFTSVEHPDFTFAGTLQ